MTYTKISRDFSVLSQDEIFLAFFILSCNMKRLAFCKLQVKFVSLAVWEREKSKEKGVEDVKAREH